MIYNNKMFGDWFICEVCKHEWRTRKETGEPVECPKCKRKYVPLKMEVTH